MGKKTRINRRAAHVCVRCAGVLAANSVQLCEKHVAEWNEYIRAYKQKRAADDRCRDCGCELKRAFNDPRARCDSCRQIRRAQRRLDRIT